MAENYQPGDHLKEGTPISILLWVQQQAWKTARLHTSTKTVLHCLCWCYFSHTFFSCWWNRRTDQQHLDRQAGPSCRLPDITLPDMMTFTALALQMGHDLKDTLHDYWSRLRQFHTPFYSETVIWDRFLHILHFLHFADNSYRPNQGEGYDRLWKLRTVFDTLN
jgi:hypothetical protein